MSYHPQSILAAKTQVLHRFGSYDQNMSRSDLRSTNFARSNAAPTGSEVVKLLNDSLATELVCAMRYKRNQFAAEVAGLNGLAKEFLDHSVQELEHADKLAQRIGQLGGKPDFAPDALIQRSHAKFDDSTSLMAMLDANVFAEQVAIKTYIQIISLIGTSDPITRDVLNKILCDELRHEEILGGWTHSRLADAGKPSL